MLVLSRHRNEGVILRDRRTNEVVCVVTLVQLRGDGHGGRARIGFNAPKWLSVHRREIDDNIQFGGLDLLAGKHAADMVGEQTPGASDET